MTRYVKSYNGTMLKEKECNLEAFANMPRYYIASDVDDFVLELPQDYWNVFNNWGAGI